MEQELIRAIVVEPMRVVSYRYVGREPEEPAIQRVIEWAAGNGLMAKERPPCFFGFNNPEPSEDDPVYGYEFCMTLDDETDGDDVVTIKNLSGGVYAVSGTRSTIGELWDWAHKDFGRWAAANRYDYDSDRQWLEEHLPNPDRLPDLPALEADQRWQAYRLLLPIKSKEQ